MKKILCMVGTRPECVKMAPVILELAASDWARPFVLSTGQHREMTRQIMDLFGIAVDVDLDVMVPDQTLAELSARIMTGLDPILEEQRPDLILVQGDTTSVMIAALAAFYRRIPIGHVEAGLRTGDIKRPFPEEMNRTVVGVLADLHFAPTAQAVKNLTEEHKVPESVFQTGNTVVDALLMVADKDLNASNPVRSGRQYILVTAHRRENWGAPIRQICEAIAELHDQRQDLEFVYPVHPNPNIHKPVHERLGDLPRVHLLPPADYADLVELIKNCAIVLTDSGGIQEEAPGLGKPVLVLREETERPEGIEAGVARLVGTDKARIIQSVHELLDDGEIYRSMARSVSPYGDGKAAGRIADICDRFLDQS